jgi:uncharacterized membrane protein YhaH (DUF805 family)
MTTFCTTCGTQLVPPARFCDNCGAAQPDRAVESAASPEPTPSARAESAPPVNPPPTSAPSWMVQNPPPPAPPPPFPHSSGTPSWMTQGSNTASAPPSIDNPFLSTLFSFDGRIGRFDYWVISIGLGVVSLILAAIQENSNNGLILVVLVVWYLASIVISLATSAKRWHDRDKSGWWILINLIPIIGWLWAFIECGFLPGDDGPNRFGWPDSGSPSP